MAESVKSSPKKQQATPQKSMKERTHHLLDELAREREGATGRIHRGGPPLHQVPTSDAEAHRDPIAVANHPVEGQPCVSIKAAPHHIPLVTAHSTYKDCSFIEVPSASTVVACDPAKSALPFVWTITQMVDSDETAPQRRTVQLHSFPSRNNRSPPTSWFLQGWEGLHALPAALASLSDVQSSEGVCLSVCVGFTSGQLCVFSVAHPHERSCDAALQVQKMSILHELFEPTCGECRALMCIQRPNFDAVFGGYSSGLLVGWCWSSTSMLGEPARHHLGSDVAVVSLMSAASANRDAAATTSIALYCVGANLCVERITVRVVGEGSAAVSFEHSTTLRHSGPTGASFLCSVCATDNTGTNSLWIAFSSPHLRVAVVDDSPGYCTSESPTEGPLPGGSTHEAVTYPCTTLDCGRKPTKSHPVCSMCRVGNVVWILGGAAGTATMYAYDVDTKKLMAQKELSDVSFTSSRTCAVCETSAADEYWTAGQQPPLAVWHLPTNYQDELTPRSSSTVATECEELRHALCLVAEDLGNTCVPVADYPRMHRLRATLERRTAAVGKVAEKSARRVELMSLARRYFRWVVWYEKRRCAKRQAMHSRAVDTLRAHTIAAVCKRLFLGWQLVSRARVAQRRLILRCAQLAHPEALLCVYYHRWLLHRKLLLQHRALAVVASSTDFVTRHFTLLRWREWTQRLAAERHHAKVMRLLCGIRASAENALRRSAFSTMQKEGGRRRVRRLRSAVVDSLSTHFSGALLRRGFDNWARWVDKQRQRHIQAAAAFTLSAKTAKRTSSVFFAKLRRFVTRRRQLRAVCTGGLMLLKRTAESSLQVHYLARWGAAIKLLAEQRRQQHEISMCVQAFLSLTNHGLRFMYFGKWRSQCQRLRVERACPRSRAQGMLRAMCSRILRQVYLKKWQAFVRRRTMHEARCAALEVIATSGAGAAMWVCFRRWGRYAAQQRYKKTKRRIALTLRHATDRLVTSLYWSRWRRLREYRDRLNRAKAASASLALRSAEVHIRQRYAAWLSMAYRHALAKVRDQESRLGSVRTEASKWKRQIAVAEETTRNLHEKSRQLQSSQPNLDERVVSQNCVCERRRVEVANVNEQEDLLQKQLAERNVVIREAEKYFGPQRRLSSMAATQIKHWNSVLEMIRRPAPLDKGGVETRRVLLASLQKAREAMQKPRESITAVLRRLGTEDRLHHNVSGLLSKAL